MPRNAAWRWSCTWRIFEAAFEVDSRVLPLERGRVCKYLPNQFGIIGSDFRTHTLKERFQGTFRRWLHSVFHGVPRAYPVALRGLTYQC
jgi:hypothetical protein